MTDAVDEPVEPVLVLAEKLARGELGRHLADVRPGTGGRQSAALALFTVDSVVLVQRAAGLRKHSGQVAFPGGAVDEGEDVVEAALRETWEETGLDPAEVSVLGVLPTTHIPVSRFDVTVVLGWWRTPHPLTAGHPDETASVAVVPLAELADPANRFTAVHPASGFESPGFDLPPLWIWGFTGFVLDDLLAQAGLEQPWDRQLRRDVPRHMVG